MVVQSLVKARVRFPWPDCLWLARHQDRRSGSQHGDGMVGQRPGLAVDVLGLVKPVGAKWPGDKEAGATGPASRRRARAGAARLDLSQGHFRTQKTKGRWIQLDLDL